MIHTLTIVHAIISVFLIIFVLLQFGKGAEAGLFSGGGEGAMFSGSQQGNILSKITTTLAIIFLSLSVALAAMRSNTTDDSVFKDMAPTAIPLNEEALAPKKVEAKDGATKEAPKAEATKGKAAAPAKKEATKK